MKMTIRAYEIKKQTNIICLTAKYVNVTNYCKLE